MFVDHNTYGIPASVGGISIKPLTWEDFKGTPPSQSPYVAHIYWNINYQFGSYSEGCQPNLTVNVNVRPKSWRIKEQIKLLQHQYGHYLIGCLCALSFIKKINYDLVKDAKVNFGDWCRQVLAKCLKQYCAKERIYDNETNHNLDREKQKQWQGKLRDEFWEFHNFFQNMAKMNRKSSDQLGRRNMSRKTGRNMINKTNDSKKVIRNNYRNFSIKRQFKNNDSCRLVSQNEATNTVDKKISINSQIRLYKRLQSDDGNKMTLPQDKQAVYLHYRMLR